MERGRTCRTQQHEGRPAQGGAPRRAAGQGIWRSCRCARHVSGRVEYSCKPVPPGSGDARLRPAPRRLLRHLDGSHRRRRRRRGRSRRRAERHPDLPYGGPRLRGRRCRLRGGGPRDRGAPRPRHGHRRLRPAAAGADVGRGVLRPPGPRAGRGPLPGWQTPVVGAPVAAPGSVPPWAAQGVSIAPPAWPAPAPPANPWPPAVPVAPGYATAPQGPLPVPPAVPAQQVPSPLESEARQLAQAAPLAVERAPEPPQPSAPPVAPRCMTILPG